MSIEIMSWIWKNSPAKGSERLVLLALADSANDDGICWPGLASLSRKANLDRRYVIDILENLEKAGYITIQRRRNGKINHSNLYRVITGVVRPASPGSEAEHTRGSEEERTRVVRPASPDPSLNRNDESSGSPQIGASAQPPQAPPEGSLPGKNGKTGKPARSQKPAKPKKPADPRTQHPAIKAIFQVVGHFPRLEEYDGIIAVLGEAPDLDKLKACWKEWRREDTDKKAFSPYTYGWAVDWYVNGVPDKSANHPPRTEPASWAALRAWAEKEHINGNEG